MSPQLRPAIQATRLDGRSLIAAGLCVLAMFFDGLGWLLGIAGIVLLRRTIFSRTVKCVLAVTAIAPKLLFIGVRSLNAPVGLSFPIEPRNMAASSSLWAWSILLAVFGGGLIYLSRRATQAPDEPVQPDSRQSLLFATLGLAPLAVAVVMLFGLTDGFHRIDDAGQGRWALRHAARGNVATFSRSELTSIDAVERSKSRGGRSYEVRVALADGRSFSVTTGSAASLEELRKFATTANLPPGAVRIRRWRAGSWTNGASGFTLKNCVGTYELTDARSRSHETFEFWLDSDRLNGKETVASPEGRHVRVLRNIKVSDNGEFEFEPATYVEASQQEKGGKVAFSFRWSPGGETGRFTGSGLQVGPQKYSRK